MDKELNEIIEVKNTELSECKEKLTFKDFIAICIAQIIVLGPILLGVVVIYFLIIMFITKVWW